uniref:RNA-directed DNA polymerase, eukaryota, reverse transcriptase zinc-binding domain protein n=1 Tax=Tanacetum cinerariifolium TaxID=118510 RepID=A0A699UUU9_TANCI|nr:RNA-directed DNA polymerase, eukaryota, reverse transcriptase zinc-binding domain protein [Tanacetum cinerariifolium]
MVLEVLLLGIIFMNIVKEVNLLVDKGIDLRSYMCFKLGNGEKVRFWEDRWSDGELLKYRFSRVYTLEMSKDITVASKVSLQNFTSSFRRHPRVGVESQQFEELMSMVRDIHLVPMADRWSWTLSSSGDFSVSSVR